MPLAKRKKAYRYGLFAEWASICLLSLKGYMILGRRVRNPLGEIDIVARRGNTLVFVEVKARAHGDDALFSIDSFKQRRLASAAAAYAASSSKFSGLDIRFDLMVVVPWQLPHHYIDAWRS